MSSTLLHRSIAAARCSSVPRLRWQGVDHLSSGWPGDADRSGQLLRDFDYGSRGLEVG